MNQPDPTEPEQTSAPDIESHEKSRPVAVFSVRGFVGSGIVWVYVCTAEYVPWIDPNDFGKLARTCQPKSPRPVSFVNEPAGCSRPVPSVQPIPPDGQMTCTSYEIAPGTGFQ